MKITLNKISLLLLVCTIVVLSRRGDYAAIVAVMANAVMFYCSGRIEEDKYWREELYRKDDQ